LHDAAHDEKGPEDPVPFLVLADESTDDGTDWGTTDGGENDEGDGVLEAGVFGLVEVSDYT
jgi:hypothetical protein